MKETQIVSMKVVVKLGLLVYAVGIFVDTTTILSKQRGAYQELPYSGLQFATQQIDLTGDALESNIAKPLNEERDDAGLQSNAIKLSSSLQLMPAEKQHSLISYSNVGNNTKEDMDFSTFLHKYQFASLLIFLVIAYLIEIIVDLILFQRLLLITSIPTCIVLGACFKSAGEVRRTWIFRLFTSIFIHLHIFHLFSNIMTLLMAWIVLESTLNLHHHVAENDLLWYYSWTFTIFMLSALLGTLATYMTTLEKTLCTLGASGGCLGLATAFMTFTLYFYGFSVSQIKRVLALCILIILSCLPINNLFLLSENSRVDYYAHIVGSCCGFIVALVLCAISSFVSPKALVFIGNILNVILILATGLAYMVILAEYFWKGPQLYINVLKTFMKVYLSKNHDLEQQEECRELMREVCVTKEIFDAVCDLSENREIIEKLQKA